MMLLVLPALVSCDRQLIYWSSLSLMSICIFCCITFNISRAVNSKSIRRENLVESLQLHNHLLSSEAMSFMAKRNSESPLELMELRDEGYDVETFKAFGLTKDRLAV